MNAPAPRVELPQALADLLEGLEAHGHSAHLIGRCVRDLIDVRPVRDFELATSADAGALRALFPNAVSLDSAGRRLLLPTPAGSVDLVPHAHGAGLAGELAHRDFTLHALAADRTGRVHDPHAGEADFRQAQLRCVGDAAERLAEDPLRALRAARLVAQYGLSPDPGLVAALGATASRLAEQPAVALRGELHGLLLGRFADRGLALLRESGLERVLAENVADDAAAVVAALPAELELRLAAWLRGTRVVRILRRLREPRPRVVVVERLLQLHPIEAVALPSQESRLRRLVRRSATLLPGLLALREAEIAARSEGEAARERLARLRDALERAGRAPERPARTLALDGEAVMKILGVGPGPHVGRALSHLAKAVEADPACNTKPALRERLLAWRSGPEGS